MSETLVHQIWPVEAPTSVRPAGGSNNLNQFVDTPSGTYLLRAYQNHRNPIRIRYELSVLTALQGADLPFRIPAPIPTRSGELLVELSEGWATLTPFVPGKPPERGNALHVRAGGTALGHLTRSLAGVRLPTEEGSLAPYGDLSQIHPMAPDPLLVPATLPISPEQRVRLDRLFQTLTADLPALYASLPQQLTHGDFARSNLLMVDGQISGVLDFEFTSFDVRAMDLATGLEAWSALSWGGEPEWELLEAFGRGYTSSMVLLDEEAEALPTLLLLRRAATLIHFTGRFRQGLETEAGLAELADWVLKLDGWMEQNASELVRCARRWTGL